MPYITALPSGLARIWAIEPDDGSPYFEVDALPEQPQSDMLLVTSIPEKLLYWESPVKPCTPIEQLQQENKLLKEQIKAMGNQYRFLEDCIAEMAAQVY